MFCLVLYWPGFKVWFHDDDFAFLGLLPGIHNAHDLSNALFQPTGHGTWRPLSERAYFIGVQTLFGVPRAWPFRAIALLTQFANLILIGAIILRLTRSRLAGLLAPILWIANSALVTVMTWDSAFMYALCGFVFLSSFWFLLRHIETNLLRYYVATWCIFLLGFLVLETNIVFPMLAITYTLFCARAYFWKVLPLSLASIAFFAAHQLMIPKQASGAYAMHFDAGILQTFGAYWVLALNPLLPQIVENFPASEAIAGVVVFTVALVGFVVYQALQRNLLPTFFLAWFVVVLGPVLPLRDHVSQYYLTLPLIGLAMLGAYAFASASLKGAALKMAALAMLTLFLVESAPSARGAAKWHYHRAQEVKRMVLGVVDAHKQDPDKTILLDGIDGNMFAAAISHRPFRFLSIPEVYLAPGFEACLDGAAQTNAHEIVLSNDMIDDRLLNSRLLVLRYDPRGWKNITQEYSGSRPSIVDVADPSTANRLGSTWYPVDGNFRWMPKCASVRVNGPASGSPTLYVAGYCAAAQVAKGSLMMTVSVNDLPAVPVKIEKGDAQFQFDFPVAPRPDGIYDVVVRVDRTFTPANDRRELGLAFGQFEIR